MTSACRTVWLHRWPCWVHRFLFLFLFCFDLFVCLFVVASLLAKHSWGSAGICNCMYINTLAVSRYNYVTACTLTSAFHRVKDRKRMYLWWSLRPLYLLACQVRVTVGESGLRCCVYVTSFERQLTPLCVDSRAEGLLVWPVFTYLLLLIVVVPRHMGSIMPTPEDVLCLHYDFVLMWEDYFCFAKLYATNAKKASSHFFSCIS